MAPSLVSSDAEDEEVEISMPSEEDLKRMSSVVERRESKRRRRQEPKRNVRVHRCSSGCEYEEDD
eukprot:4446464-Karenia_brevis.AAC.1